MLAHMQMRALMAGTVLQKRITLSQPLRSSKHVHSKRMRSRLGLSSHGHHMRLNKQAHRWIASQCSAHSSETTSMTAALTLHIRVAACRGAVREPVQHRAMKARRSLLRIARRAEAARVLRHQQWFSSKIGRGISRTMY